ncbi:unnamed protein product, partial [Ectocarpus sp. 8 AP-2014]
GCDWKGTRRQRRRHLAACPMWQVMCPGCCRAVHVAEFGRHLLGHSAASESPALNPPGCPLRAYGCLACRAAPPAITTNSCSGSGSSNSCGGSGSSNSCGSSGSSDDAVASTVPRIGDRIPNARASYEAAATAAATTAAAAKAEAEAEVGVGKEGGGHGTAG